MKRLFIILLAAALFPAVASAKSTGTTGYSGKNGTTCTSCHPPPSFWKTSANLSGPTFLKPGAKGQFSLVVTTYGMLANNSGLNVSATGGKLSVFSGEPLTMMSGPELTHSKPKKPTSIYSAIWKFEWTAPSIPGTYTLYGAGLLGNGKLDKNYDRTGSTKFSVSVGQCQSSKDCDDKDACTKDLCDAKTKKCVNTKMLGCCSTSAECNDKNPCTKDTCNTLIHKCLFSYIPGCCKADSECKDPNVCTKDTCDLLANKCVYAQIKDCCYSTIQCDDGNKCTKDTCDTVTHKCIRYPIPGCCKNNGDCKDNNVCTKDTCNVSTGICLNAVIKKCCHSIADCSDNNICTSDTCVKNICSNQKIPGCCLSIADCNDKDKCTKDTCTNNICSNLPIPNCKADAGTPPPPDSGPAQDGPMTTKDGPVTTKDGPAATKDGPKKDAVAKQDSSSGGDTGTTTPVDEDGCCRVSHAQPSTRLPLWILLGLGLLLALRRRRL